MMYLFFYIVLLIIDCCSYGYFYYYFFYKFIYWLIFLGVLGLRFCVRAFSSCGERGPLFIVVRGPLTVVASLVVEHKLQTCRLSSCGSRAQLLHDMWDLPRPGLEPVSPALAGRFSTTAPPGKPLYYYFLMFKLKLYVIYTLLLPYCRINYDYIFTITSEIYTTFLCFYDVN